MTNGSSGNIEVGNVTGQGIAIGHGASASVRIFSAKERDQLTALIQQLVEEIRKADIPEPTKAVLADKAVRELEQAAKAPDPKPGLTSGLERINDHLQGVGAAADKVAGIVGTVTKIASSVGLVVKTVAPYLASLL